MIIVQLRYCEYYGLVSGDRLNQSISVMSLCNKMCKHHVQSGVFMNREIAQLKRLFFVLLTNINIQYNKMDSLVFEENVSTELSTSELYSSYTNNEITFYVDSSYGRCILCI